MMSIKKELTVDVSQETAFRVFSEKMDLWWPRSHHVGKTPLVKMVLEPKAQGRWYSIHQNSEESAIGYVQDFKPNSHLLLIWQLNGEFQYDSALHTEVDINFTVKNPERTLVTFEHRNIEKLGKVIDGMNEGWSLILDLYAKLASVGKLQGEALKIYQRTILENPCH